MLKKIIEQTGLFTVDNCLGHSAAELKSVAFVVTFQRGVEWAATGKVPQKVPADFPTADKASVRE